MAYIRCDICALYFDFTLTATPPPKSKFKHVKHVTTPKITSIFWDNFYFPGQFLFSGTVLLDGLDLLYIYYSNIIIKIFPCTSLLKTLLEKEKLLVTTHHVF